MSDSIKNLNKTVFEYRHKLVGNSSIRMKKISILFLLIFFCSINIFGQTYDINYSSGTNYETAGFRYWAPKTDIGYRALLVIVPGYNSDGRNAVNDTIWQTFACENKLAVVACYFKDYKNPDIFYREASKGSGNALLDAINQFAEISNHPEILKIPFIMYGESAGGQFNYEFACWKPERVLTFVVNKGGYYHTAFAPEATRKTPAIFFIGENDLFYRKDIIQGIYSMNRKLGAYWTLIAEKDIGHDCKVSKPLAIKYFENIIPLRLTSSNKLADLNEIEYYLGNWETKTVKPFRGATNSDSLTVWIPNSAFAKIWVKQFE